MNDLMCVHPQAGANELYEEETRFRLGESLSPSEHVHQRLCHSQQGLKNGRRRTYTAFTEPQGHIDVRIVLEALFKRNYIGVFE